MHFVGHLSSTAYARLLKSSHVHCYLTRPFVASWSLLDAMSSGCYIVASDTKPVRELAHPSATTWVDHRDPANLLNGLEQALRVSPEERNERGRLQRQLAVDCWSRHQSLRSWRGLLEI